MEKELMKVSIRQGAIYIAKSNMESQKDVNHTTSVLVANASKLGFTFSEELLRAINGLTPRMKMDILDTLKTITGVKKNWTPLVKGWDVPTGETRADHAITFLANLFKSKRGTRLDCGHVIPENTFPLERYNGCPYCGTPFEFGKIEKMGQGSKLKVLELWDEAKMMSFFKDLLASKTALDATQVDSLKTLLKHFTLPEGMEVGMKETMVLVVDTLIEQDKGELAKVMFKSPADILRYLWYKKTGFLQIIEPKTLVQRISKNNKHIYAPADTSGIALVKSKADMKLKYSRKEGKMVAAWMNHLALSVEKSCEIMHAKRGMWVRFIRALRLAEYSHRKGFEKLESLLDVFYNQTYEVWQGRVNHYRLRSDADKTFALLKQRPGLFARSLFSNMLWFGDEITLKHFAEVADKVPARLVFTLNMYAQIYFVKSTQRSVKPLGGTNKRIPAHPLLEIYTDEQLEKMKSRIEDLSLDVMRTRFANTENESMSMFIHPQLYKIPLSIGDRSETVQDLPSALMGTRFPIEGNKVRLFMQWGEGLPKQHLDMDLSCRVAYNDKTEYCSYSQLNIYGCKHSGDIQSIPNKVGTAEYIEINVKDLAARKAKYVSFTCNAYSNGAITPNLIVGWMSSKHKMHISRKSGVAYDPSCVQHQVRVTQGVNKGLVFGVLDVAAREIVWLEMSFGGQVVQNLDTKNVETLLAKLDAKLSIGNLLDIKAEAQGLYVSDVADADEIYDLEWAANPAKVTSLFLD